MSHEELKELKVQLKELSKGYIKPNKSPYGAQEGWDIEDVCGL